MERTAKYPGSIRLIFPFSCAALVLAALCSLVLGPEARLVGNIALGLGLLLAALAWLLFERGYRRPALALLVYLGRVAEGLETLASSLTKLSTGNLAAKASPASELPPAVPEGMASAGGELASIARFSSGMASLVGECIESFNGITDEPCLRLCYVGSDSYAEGEAIGAAIGHLLGGSGSLAVITADFRSANHSLRRKGVANILAAKFPKIELLETVEAFEDVERSYAAACDILKRHKELGAFYVTDGSSPPGVARAVEDSGRKGKTLVVGHDLTDATMKYLEKGVIAATLSQDPFAQGHDPIIRLYNHIAADWRPPAPRFLTGLQVVDKENYRRFWSEGKSAGAGDRERLAKVLPRAAGRGDRRIRIAMVCMESDGFWQPVYEGAMEAKRELQALGATVEWFELPRERNLSLTAASSYVPILERLAKEGRDGVAIPVFDRELVPVLNRLARSGTAIATFNAEPPSLREMLSTVSTQVVSLLSLSQELATSAEESGQSTVSIAATMERITAGLRAQADESGRTQEGIVALAENIGRVNETASATSKMARLVAEASDRGSTAVGRMRESVRSLEGASSLSESAILSLREDSERIGKIVESIEEIANQTNVLAINASIQAARAGEQGRGFGVIASEVRKLAEQSNQSALEIKRVIGALKLKVRDAEEATSKGLAQAKANSENAELSMSSLAEISSLAQENERSMDVIFASVEKMLSFSRRIEETARELAKMNERSDLAATEIGTSTKEVSAQASEVAASARSIADMAKAQRVLLTQFRLTD
jgi:methyl-accepting chemotaxis protein